MPVDEDRVILRVGDDARVTEGAYTGVPNADDQNWGHVVTAVAGEVTESADGAAGFAVSWCAKATALPLLP